MNTLTKDLEQLIGRDNVAAEPEDLLSYQADATFYFARKKPDAVVLPTSTQAVSDVVAYASKNEIPLVPRGAGSGLSGGCTPIRGGIVLDTKRMNRILDINQGNLTATTECGVVLANFHRAVEKLNLYYPPDPQSMTVCTLGGNVATRAGGPHGVKYGTTSNYVLGLEVVLPDGSVINTGSSCVKHSVGYDLTHLLTGSEGTLGVITKVTTRLLPRPQSDRTIVVTCKSPAQASKTVSAIIAAGIVPAVMEYIPQSAIRGMNQYITPPLIAEGEAFLFIKLDGLDVQIDQESERIRPICLDLDVMDIRIVTNRKEADSYWLARSKLQPLLLSFMKKIITEDITVPRDKLPEFIGLLSEISDRLDVLTGIAGHAGDGNIHPTILMMEINENENQKAEQAIREIIQCGLHLGGSISGEHGIGLHKSEYIVEELGQRQVDLFKAIKRTIDPKGIMNPGKIWTEEENNA